MSTIRKYIESMETAKMWGEIIAKKMQQAISKIIPDVAVVYDSNVSCFYIVSDKRMESEIGTILIENVCEACLGLKNCIYSSTVYLTEEEAEELKRALLYYFGEGL